MRLTPAEWDLIRDYWPHVRAVAARYARPGRDADEIESAVQWGLVRAALDWSAGRTGPGRPDFGTVAVTRMHRAARAVAWHAAGWSVVTDSGASSRGRIARRDATWDGYANLVAPDPVTDPAEEFEALCRAVPIPDRPLIRLIYLHGLTPAEAARELGWSWSRAEYRLRAALIDVRRHLRERDRKGA